jgi:uncharacterized protein (UPF0335 family)/disulfide oxidoreductase YuzD
MGEGLEQIILSIAKLEEERKELAEKLRGSSIEIFPDALERGLIHKIDKKEINAKIAAVDGGLLAQEFHGFDLVLSRAVAVIFEYENSSKKKHFYHPRAFPEPDVDALTALDTHEFTWHKGLFRLKKEIRTAIETIEKFKPDYLFIDGSIVPQISDKPSEDSLVRPLYNEVVSYYGELYEKSEKNDCQLVGIIKDSRGKRFIEIIEKSSSKLNTEILKKSNDSSFLHFLLNEGERTFTLNYASSAREHQVLKDLKDWGARVKILYMKPVSEDRPLRVEFLDVKKEVDEVASLVYSISKINKKYAYPAILIEADMRAAMDRLEIDRAYGNLLLKAGMRSSILKLRRDMRPFR